MRSYKSKGKNTREEVKRLHEKHTVKEMCCILGKSEVRIRAILSNEGLKAKKVVTTNNFNKEAIIQYAQNNIKEDSSNWIFSLEVLKTLGIRQSNENITGCRKVLRENFKFKEARGRKKREIAEVSTLSDEVIECCNQAMKKDFSDIWDVDLKQVDKLEEIDYYEFNKYRAMRR